MYFEALDKAKVAKAIADIRTLSSEIGTHQLFNGSLAAQPCRRRTGKF
jgi:hypothetical protein